MRGVYSSSVIQIPVCFAHLLHSIHRMKTSIILSICDSPINRHSSAVLQIKRAGHSAASKRRKVSSSFQRIRSKTHVMRQNSDGHSVYLKTQLYQFLQHRMISLRARTVSTQCQYNSGTQRIHSCSQIQNSRNGVICPSQRIFDSENHQLLYRRNLHPRQTRMGVY